MVEVHTAEAHVVVDADKLKLECTDFSIRHPLNIAH